MKFLRFGNCDLIIPESEVVLIKSEDGQDLLVYHARNLDDHLCKIDITECRDELELRKFIKELLSRSIELLN